MILYVDSFLYLSSQRLYLDDQLRSIDELSSPGWWLQMLLFYIWDHDPQCANEQLKNLFSFFCWV